MVVIGSLGIRGYAKMGAFVRAVLISEKALSVSAVHWIMGEVGWPGFVLLFH